MYASGLKIYAITRSIKRSKSIIKKNKKKHKKPVLVLFANISRLILGIL